MNFLEDISEGKEEEIKEIREFVEKERNRSRIEMDNLGTSHRSEGSCYAYGEFHNLVYAQLLHTKYPYGGWQELKGEVLEGTLEFIRNIKEYRKNQKSQ